MRPCGMLRGAVDKRGKKRKEKEGEVRNEPKGCGCWRAEGSMSDHQPLGFLQPPATSQTASLLSCYNVDLSSFDL